MKLSALHPRYEYHQRDRCVPALAERLAALGARAKAANIGLTIDAEEADRLEVSLLVFAELLQTQRWQVGTALALPFKPINAARCR